MPNDEAMHDTNQAEAPASMARLDELIALTERYATGNSAGGKPATSSGGTGRAAGTTSEEQEDADMVQDELAQENAHISWPTHFDKQPSCVVGGTMRDYQIEALNWIIGLQDSGLNGILADEMGLGKTLQSISVLGYLKQYRQISDPHIVIVPKSTLGNWCREFTKWCPSLSVLRFHGTKEERADLRTQLADLGSYDVVVTTYEMVVKEKSSLGKIPWHFMYIDEAHRIKNEYSILSQVVRTYSTKHRLLITGTPLQNNLHELWALLNFLLPHLFGSGDDFNEWFSVIESQDSVDLIVKRLHRVLRPFLLRRLKSDVEKSLLPKIETILHVGMTVMQRDWYTKLLTRDIDALNSATGSRVRFLNLLMQLRKTCNHPYLFQGAEPGPPFIEGPHLVSNAGKMMLLDKLIDRLNAKGSRVLIFSQMTRMLDILEDYLRIKGLLYCRIDGQTSQENREEQMESFNAPHSPQFAFLLSTRAGGLGINLQTADTVILYDSDWNPQMDLQAQDRAHRIGQKKQVHVYRLVTEGTVEEKIVERAYRKLFLDAVVIQQGRLSSQANKLESSELSEMVRFGADQIFRSKESTVTDEDIDAIMEKGKAKTEAITNTLQTNASFNLANFSLSENKGNVSIYDFGGENFKEKQIGDTTTEPSFAFIAMPKRDRKPIYENDDYYGGGSNSKTSLQDRTYKPRQRYDFQFFKVDRIQQLEEIQFEAKKRTRIMLNELREKERVQKIILKEKEREAKEKGEDGSIESQASPPINVFSSQDNNPVDVEDDLSSRRVSRRRSSRAASHEPIPVDLSQLDKQEQIAELERQSGGLTEHQKRELQRLEAEGFGSWKTRDFANFIRGSELCGRDDFAGIAKHVQTKTVDEIRDFHSVFWKRYKELRDWKRYISQIEKGEARITRFEQIKQVIADKMELDGSMEDLKFVHTGKVTAAMSGYVDDEDRFVFKAMFEHGYMNWDEIRASIKRSWHFRFDWFIKSRSSADIAKRCDYLISLAEKELEAIAKAASHAKAKKRKLSTPKASVRKTKQTKQTKKKSTPSSNKNRARR